MKISNVRCPACGNECEDEFRIEKSPTGIGIKLQEGEDPNYYQVECSCGARGMFGHSPEEAIEDYQKKFGIIRMADPVPFIEQTRKSRFLTRFAAQMFLNRQNVAEHEFATASIFIALSKYWGIPVSLQAVDFVLNHDLLETETGDLLYPVKHAGNNADYWNEIEKEVVKNLPLLENYLDNNDMLTNDEKWLFRFSDLLEGLITCLEELRFGNKNPSVYRCRQVYLNALEKISNKEPKITLLIERIQERLYAY